VGLTLALPSGIILQLGGGFSTDEEALKNGKSVAYRRGRIFSLMSTELPECERMSVCPYELYSDGFFDWIIGFHEERNRTQR
jgi:hypothetical protein